jgi:dolichol-phosphate mannosyltransferase
MSSPQLQNKSPLVVCTVPTYNEAGNIIELSRRLLALGPEYRVLVIDDDSPDGTWKLVADAAQSEPRLHLLHRRGDKGRGAAGREGFVRALEMGADIVVEMDADFSHDPGYVPAMISRLNRRGEEVGLVLGSRAVPGGVDADRSLWRQLLTKGANSYIRLLLGVPVHDCNSGFRCWRRETLLGIGVEKTFSQGPGIVQELLYRTARAKIDIAELPIEFRNRLHGESQLSLPVLIQGYVTVLKLLWLALLGRL